MSSGKVTRFLAKVPAWLFSAVTLAAICWLTLAPHPLGEADIPLFPGADKLAHWIMFGFLTAVILFDHQRLSGWAKVRNAFCLCMIALSTAIGAGIEFLQGAMHVGRTFDLSDIIADFGGSLSFGLIYLFLQPRWSVSLSQAMKNKFASVIPDSDETGGENQQLTDDTEQPAEDGAPQKPGKPAKRHLIKPKWLRIILKTLGWIFVFILLIPVLIYIPPVQTLLKNIAAKVVYEQTGMKVKIDCFRLKFPVDVSLQGVTVWDVAGDTMVNAREAIADVKLRPLFSLDVKLNRLKLLDGYYRMVSPDSSMIMKIRAGLLDVDGKSSANIKTSTILLNKAMLSDGSVSLYMNVWKKKPTPPDSVKPSTPFLIKANDLKLSNFTFAMSMLPTIDTLSFHTRSLDLRKAVIDLGKNEVTAGYLAGADGNFTYLAPTPEYVRTHPAPIDTISPPSPPMIIKGDTVSLERFKVLYGIKGARPQPGFDANYISMSDVSVGLRDFYNCQSVVRLPITRLMGRERCGLAITSGSGLVAIDSLGLDFRNLDVSTPASRIRATAAVPFALMELKPTAPLNVLADASVAPADIVAFMPALRTYTSKLPTGRPLTLALKATGTLSDVDIPALTFNVPGVLDFAAKGEVRNPLDMKRLAGNLVFDGSITGPATVKSLANLNDLDIPALELKGKATAANQEYTADFSLFSEAGDVVGQGLVSLTSERYEADIDMTGLQVGRFMPALGIGSVTASVSAACAGFDPTCPGAATEADAEITSAVYKGHEYRDISLSAKLLDGAYDVYLSSPDPLLNLTLDASGTVAPDDYSFDVRARINHVDLQALGITPGICSGNADINLTGTASPGKWLYDARLDVENFDWNLNDGFYHIPDGLTAVLKSTPGDVSAHLASDMTDVDFTCSTGLKQILDKVNELTPVLTRQLKERNLDIDQLQKALPPFNLAMNASGKGLVRQFLTASGMSIDTLYANFSNDSILSGNAYLGRLNTGSLTLDTLSLRLQQRGSVLDYRAHLGNAPGTLDEFARVNVNGYVGANRGSLFLTQQNIQGKTGYRLGFTAALSDSTVTLHFSPLKATIAYMPWTLNADNHLDYTFNNSRIDANLLARSAESSIMLLTEDNAETGREELQVKIDNLKIQDFLRLSVFAPPLTAAVSTDLRVSQTDKAIIGNGTVQVKDFVYNKMRVGDFDLDLKAGMGQKGNSGGRAALKINGRDALVLRGVLLADSAGSGLRPRNVSLELTHFPLSVANPFLGKDVARLSGALNGKLYLAGTFTAPLLRGSIACDSVNVFIPMIGSSLRFDTVPITVDDNRIAFNDFDIWGANSNPITINGNVDARKFSDISFDLGMKGTNVQLVNSERKSRSEIYGKLFVDLTASARGPMKHFDVNASLNILGTTDINYQMQTEAQTIVQQNSSGDVVKFVVFADSAQVSKADSVPQEMNMRIMAALNIQPGTRAKVFLSPTNSSDRVELTPSGQLNFFQNYMGDQRLTGQLNLGTGFARYSLPVMGEKRFDFEPGCYVLWNGVLLNPVLHINAYDDMKINVVQSSGNTQLVKFRVGLSVANTLSAPDVRFDLSADDNITIQNELSSMTAEQRQTAAMNMLITRQYTGGDSKTAQASMGNMANNALYGFLTSQLNNWTANHIRGVDLSFGVDQYENSRNGQNSTSTSYSYQVSKSLFNNRFKIVVGGNYSTDASADENFAQNLLSDISFEYILKQTNTMSMYLKLFRHNGFESVLEGEITETGVGFVMRRRLSNLKQLFRFMRPRRKKLEQEEEAADSTSVAREAEVKNR